MRSCDSTGYIKKYDETYDDIGTSLACLRII